MATARADDLVAMLEQRVQIVDERLHLGRVVALRPARPARHGRAPAARADRETTTAPCASATKPATQERDDQRDAEEASAKPPSRARRRATGRYRIITAVATSMRPDEQPERPEDGAPQDPRAE